MTWPHPLRPVLLRRQAISSPLQAVQLGLEGELAVSPLANAGNRSPTSFPLEMAPLASKDTSFVLERSYFLAFVEWARGVSRKILPPYLPALKEPLTLRGRGRRTSLSLRSRCLSPGLRARCARLHVVTSLRDKRHKNNNAPSTPTLIPGPGRNASYHQVEGGPKIVTKVPKVT